MEGLGDICSAVVQSNLIIRFILFFFVNNLKRCEHYSSIWMGNTILHARHRSLLVAHVHDTGEAKTGAERSGHMILNHETTSKPDGVEQQIHNFLQMAAIVDVRNDHDGFVLR